MNCANGLLCVSLRDSQACSHITVNIDEFKSPEVCFTASFVQPGILLQRTASKLSTNGKQRATIFFRHGRSFPADVTFLYVLLKD